MSGKRKEGREEKRGREMKGGRGEGKGINFELDPLQNLLHHW